MKSLLRARFIEFLFTRKGVEKLLTDAPIKPRFISTLKPNYRRNYENQMKTKITTRTTEITIEKSERVAISKSPRVFFGWCAKCAAKVRMVTPEEAARIQGVSTRTVYSRIEAGQIHFEEINDRLLLVCLNSLFS